MKKILCMALLAICSFQLISCATAPPEETAADVDFAITEKESETEQNESLPQTEQIAETILEVPALCQYPTLPTGCEAVAAAMVLQYYGERVSAEEFARTWLECSRDFYSWDGMNFGPDPNLVFAGDPFSANSYGCFAGAITSAINRESKICVAKTIQGLSLPELCAEYIDNGKPLLVWATMSMKQSSPGNSWYLKNREKFTWIAGEHCLVLVGYNEGYYFFNDPMSGSTVAYQKHIVEARFEELSQQAVCVSPIQP